MCRSKPARPGAFLPILLTAGPFFFIQTSKGVLIIEPDEGQARRIHLQRLPFGEGCETVLVRRNTVGHYEDDTLVVDTIGFERQNLVDKPHASQREAARG